MIKTYLVPITDEVIKAMEKGEAPSFLHCATCLDELTNGEVIQNIFPQIEVRDSEVSDWHICVSFNPNEPWEWFDKDFWNRKWGE